MYFSTLNRRIYIRAKILILQLTTLHAV